MLFTVFKAFNAGDGWGVVLWWGSIKKHLNINNNLHNMNHDYNNKLTCSDCNKFYPGQTGRSFNKHTNQPTTHKIKLAKYIHRTT